MADREAHIEDGEQLFRTGMFSDCRVYCKDRSWNLHRAILATRSDFFRACFTFGFPEPSLSRVGNDQTTTQTKSVTLPSVAMNDDNPDALDRMLRYIYTYTYPTLDSSSPETAPATAQLETKPTVAAAFWTSELALLLIADKYSLTSLQIQAASSIIDAARTHISDPTSNSQCDTFLNQIEDFVEMLETLFTDSAVQGMETVLGIDIKREVLDVTGEMIAKFIATNDKLVELMVTVPGFGIMLVQSLGVRDDNQDVDELQEPESVQVRSRESGHEGTTVLNGRRAGYHGGGSVSSENGSGSWSGSEGSTGRYNHTSNGEVGSRTLKRAKTSKGKKQGSQEQMVPKVHIPMNEESDLD